MSTLVAPASLRSILWLLPAALLLGASAEAVQIVKTAKATFPKAGLWRGVFDINGNPLPFEFEIKGKRAEDATFTLINGTRRDDFKVEQIAPDTLFIKMNTQDAAIEAKIESREKLVGVYKSLVPNKRGSDLPFIGEYGKKYRFVEPAKNVQPRADLNGKWAIEILSEESNPSQVALLKQNGNQLGGVFMTVVGDTRELAGTLQGNEFFLSGFTGPSPVLIKGTVAEDGSLTGTISRGLNRPTKFAGRKQDQVELPDPYKLTYLKPGYSNLDFTFPDLNGKPVSLSDAKYQGKVVLVEIIGSWCPNCTDQTRFLAPWYRANKDRGVEVIAIAFEQEDSLEYARYTLGKFREFFDIQYDIVFGGIADKKVATEKLGALNFMAAFPTTIVIDRKGDVRQIHTGYTGEVTGEYFKEYVRKFNENLDALLAEPNPQADKSTLQWQWRVEPQGVKAGDEAELVFSAAIPSGLILYSSDFKAELGPRPAKFTFDATEAVELNGPVTAVQSKRRADKTFGTEYSYFAGRAEFRQKIRVLKSGASVSGRIDGQTCQEQDGVCLLFKEPFAIRLN